MHARTQVPIQPQQRAVVEITVAWGDQQDDHLQQGDQGRLMEEAELRGSMVYMVYRSRACLLRLI